MMAELQKEGAGDIEAFSNLSEINYRRVPSGSVVNSGLQIMELHVLYNKFTSLKK
jgi:hypothetical protein